MKKYRFILAVLAILISNNSKAQVFKTQEQALAEVFADCDTVVRQTLFLDDAQITKLEHLSKSKFDSRIISYYVGKQDDKIFAFAFFEKQVVRTKNAILMIAILPNGSIRKVEVLAFLEPQDYLPIAGWFELFEQKTLSNDLWPGRAIHAVSGATLSVHAFTFAARRALALHKMITVENQ